MYMGVIPFQTSNMFLYLSAPHVYGGDPLLPGAERLT